MLSAGTKKRITRIRRRAIPEVQEAFRDGKISARRADQLLYLEPEQQRAELARILSAQEDLSRRSRIATEVIRRHINAKHHDLAASREDLRLALSRA